MERRILDITTTIVVDSTLMMTNKSHSLKLIAAAADIHGKMKTIGDFQKT
jgi:hypothetical protein